MLTTSSNPINAHMDTYDCGLSRTFIDSVGGCEWSDTPNNALVKDLFIFNSTEYTRSLSLPTDKKP